MPMFHVKHSPLGLVGRVGKADIDRQGEIIRGLHSLIITILAYIPSKDARRSADLRPPCGSCHPVNHQPVAGQALGRSSGPAVGDGEEQRRAPLRDIAPGVFSFDLCDLRFDLLLRLSRIAQRHSQRSDQAHGSSARGSFSVVPVVPVTPAFRLKMQRWPCKTAQVQ